MAVRLNHTIVAAHDKEKAALFLTEILGLPAPLLLGPFAMVQVGDTSLDYVDVKEYGSANGEITSQHYAFLVNESEFDEIQFTKAPQVLKGMGLDGLGKSAEALRELAAKGMAPGIGL